MLHEVDPTDLMSQLMARQQLPGGTEARAQGSGGVPALQQGLPMSGLMANLSDPAALPSLLQTGVCCVLKNLFLAAVV